MKVFGSIVSIAMCAEMFMHTACPAGVNCRLVAFAIVGYLQLFLVVLIVEARFPAGAVINNNNKK